MKIKNICTLTQFKCFIRRRNGCFGQLKMMEIILKQMINTDLITQEDSKQLSKISAILNPIISKWDKHYVKNLNIQFKK